MKFWTALGLGIGLGATWIVYQHMRQTTRMERKIDTLVEKQAGR